MTIQDFTSRFREAFGDMTPMPIAIGYSDEPAAESGSIYAHGLFMTTTLQTRSRLSLHRDALQSLLLPLMKTGTAVADVSWECSTRRPDLSYLRTSLHLPFQCADSWKCWTQ